MSEPAKRDWQMLFAAGLVVLEAAVLLQFSGRLFVPVLCLLATFAFAGAGIRIGLSRRGRLVTSMFLLLAFVIKLSMIERTHIAGRSFIQTPAAFTIGEFFLSLQTFLLCCRYSAGRIPIGWGTLAAAAIVFSSDVLVSPAERTGMRFVLLVFIVLLGGFFLASRTPLPKSARRPGGYFVSLLLVCVCIFASARGASSVLERYDRELEQFILGLFKSQKGVGRGFSGQATLNSVSAVRARNEKHIALRVRATTIKGEPISHPLYLRARAYDYYESRRWISGARQAPTLPIVDAKENSENRYFGDHFPIGAGTARPRARLVIQQDIETSGELFVPLDVRELYAPVDMLHVSDDRTLFAESFEVGDAYVAVIGDRERIELPDDRRKRYLSLIRPGPILKKTAAELFADCETTAEKIDTVTRFFRNNFEYRFGLTVPRRTEPIEWFLRDRPPAHCEFFAAATVLLLRQSGVPARYVTGFVAAEINPFNDEHIARNRDAHAWAEAWDANKGWVIVESTPAEGVPENHETSLSWGQLWESLKTWGGRLRNRWKQGGWSVALRDIGRFFFFTWIGWLILGAIALRVLLRYRSAWFGSRGPASPITKLSETHEALKRLAQTMFKALAKRELAMSPGETVLHFASRVEGTYADAAGWLREYAFVRYAPQITEADCEQLAARLAISLPAR